MKLRLSIIALFTTVTGLFAQFSNFNTQKNWSMNKKEFIFGGGGTQFLGDLGGGKGVGKDYSLADLDFNVTRFNLMVGYRYRFHPVFATTSTLNFGQYKASDLETPNEGRAPRKITIKSFLFNFTQRFEYIVYANEKVGKRNNIPGLKGMKDKNTQFYIYTGLGLAYYNPQGLNYADGTWEYLRPLKTEGQGYPGGANGYRRITAAIPFGVGYRIGLGRMWRLMIEATYFKTFTDYMDDVSTTYFSYKTSGITASPEQVYYSNPSEDWTKFKNGDKRGDNEKDAFFYFNIGFSKNITYRNYVRGKPIKWRGVRAKF